jgi:hypothetical protein
MCCRFVAAERCRTSTHKLHHHLLIQFSVGLSALNQFLALFRREHHKIKVPGTSNIGEDSSELYILDDPLAAQFIFKSIKAQRLLINHRTPKHKQTVFSTLKLLVEFPVKIQQESLTIPFSSHGFHRHSIHCSTLTHKSL